ncbi:MAG: C10 family peptidase [Muribaculaceae bacterium]|nr:C10 family peptidase [Muribaculaceae bacterium]
MKKLILIMALGLFFASCSQDEGIVAPTDTETTKTSGLCRTPEEAIAVADNFLAAVCPNSRSEQRRVATVDIIGSHGSRSSSDTLMYAINYKDNNGFVLVSAARTGLDVIGYDPEGELNLEEYGNEAFNFYMECAKEYVASELSITPVPIPDPTPKDYTITMSVEPKLTVSWGQVNPEGLYCPNGVAGCLQTAMAQAMSYLEQPTSINLTYYNRDVDTQVLDWADIKNHVISSNYAGQAYLNIHAGFCNASMDAHKALGRLCRQLGELNEAFYIMKNDSIPPATGALTEKGYATFKSLVPGAVKKVLTYFNDTRQNMLTDMASCQGIAILEGFTAGGAGHAWVADGGHNIQTIAYGVGIDGEMITTYINKDCYYHFNWGWNGSCNGYFAGGVFNSDTPLSRNNYDRNVRYFVVAK